MADWGNIVYQVRSIRVLGPTLVEDVEQIGVKTQPTGIYFEFPVDYAIWQDGLAAEVVAPIASKIEELIASTAAVNAVYVQDLDTTNLLTDFLDFVVQYIPPPPLSIPQTTTVRLDLTSIAAEAEAAFGGFQGYAENAIQAAYNTLVQTASA